jgi:hypothetical protein
MPQCQLAIRVKRHRHAHSRSRDIPQPNTRTFFGKPIGSSISGRKMPDYAQRSSVIRTGFGAAHIVILTLPTSIHFPRPLWYEKISILGCRDRLDRQFTMTGEEASVGWDAPLYKGCRPA